MRQPPRALLISALLLGAAVAAPQPVRSGLLSALRLPLTVLKTGVAILVNLPSLPALARENAMLRARLTQQEADAARLREALRRAAQAEALAAMAPSGPVKGGGMIADVIGRSTIPTQQTVLLDKGARHGLVLDSTVLESGGLVGRVVEVHPTTGLALLLTDPESRVAGLVERSRETGLLIGRGRGLCEFIYLDAHADIEEGDRILTAGLGGPFPKGLLLGTAVRVARDELSGTAVASVKPAARLGRMEEVLCVPPEN